MILELTRACKSYINAETGEEVICLRGAKRLGWPETDELTLEVSNVKSPGFTEVSFEEWANSEESGYTIYTGGEEFYDAYNLVLDYLDNHETLYYRLLNG